MTDTTSGQAARLRHTGEGYCEKCNTHYMADGVCKCPAVDTVSSMPEKKAPTVLHGSAAYCAVCGAHFNAALAHNCPAETASPEAPIEAKPWTPAELDNLKPLPVSGYTSQSTANVNLANELKEAEERYLRLLDRLSTLGYDGRSIAEARTCINTGAMWAVRAIFQPKRIALPGDDVARAEK